MRRIIYVIITVTLFYFSSKAQVDTSYLHGSKFGDSNLDIRIYIDQNNYYYLEEGKTFSYREVDGQRTNTYFPMAGFNTSQYTEGHLRKQNGPSSSQFVMNYRLLFPKNYDENYSSGYPLILMVHGFGERGNCWDPPWGNLSCYWSNTSWDPNVNNPPVPATNTGTAARLLNNDHNLLHGGKVHLDAVNLANGKLPNDPTLPSRAFPGFVLFPQNLNGWGSRMPSNAYDVIRLVRLVSKEYNINPNRIYIHGLSEGGAAVYHIIRRAPWLFSAVMTMSAVNDGGIIFNNLQNEVVSLPIRTFQGGKDEDPTPTETRGYVVNFKNAGLDIKYYLYSHLGHGTWNTAYSEPDFFSWMLSKNKANPHIKYGVDYICGSNGAGAELIYAKGFFAYQWEKDGVIIPGATSHSYIATTPGTYRGRFSRVPNPGANDWNRWSDPIVIQEKTLPAPPITAKYSTIFPNINNDNAVALETELSEEGYGYRWYQNGNPINFAFSSEDDTVRNFTITNSTFGDGEYIVKNVEGQCESLPSDPVYVRYATAETLTPPSNPAATAISASSIFLNWTDNSSNEKGFEIWRRKGSSGKFEFIALTAANAVSYKDTTNLEPSSEYHYKVRAVSNTSRSAYAPGNDPVTNVIVTTFGDNTPPGAPQNLSIVSNNINSISLSWNAATDNTGIKQYHITYGSNTVATGSDTTRFTITGLNMNSQYTITVRAEDLAGHRSPRSNQVVGNTYMKGLEYQHTTGAWASLTSVNWNFIEYRGMVNNFTLTPRTQEDYFNFKFDGYLFIPETQYYQFRIRSDDGSMLFLNGFNSSDLTQHRIINNDFIHGNITVESEEILLTQGPHRIVALYFEHAGSQNLTVSYRKKSDSTTWDPDWTVIPDSMLTTGTYTPPVSLPAPTNLTATAGGMTQMNLSWQYTGSSSDMFEIYRSASQNGVYEIIGSTTSTSFHDAGLTPASTYYYKIKSIANNGSSSSFSNLANGTTSSDNVAPSAPSNLQLASNGAASVGIIWTASTDNTKVTGYNIYVNGSLHGSTGSPGYLVDELLPNTTYTIRVRAYDANNNLSAFSPALSVMTTSEHTACDFMIEASDICNEPELSIYVTQTQTGTSYVASLSGRDVSESVVSTGQDIVLKVPSTELTEGTNTITVTAGQLCRTELPSKDITIHYTVPPVTAVETDSLSICEGDTVILKASGAPEDGHYKWYNNDGELASGSSGSSYVTSAIYERSTFQVKAVTSNGCEGNPVDILITPEKVPDPVIGWADSTHLMIDAEITDGITIEWYLNGEPLQERDRILQPLLEGFYSAVLTQNGCIKYSEPMLVEIDQVTSVNPTHPYERVFNVHPNPARSVFNIDIGIKTSSIESMQISMSDLSGRILYTAMVTPRPTGMYQVNIPEHVLPGIYILTIEQGKTKIRRKIAVAK